MVKKNKKEKKAAQETNRQTAVKNVFARETAAKNQRIAEGRASGGELNKPLRSREEILREATKSNIPVTKREERAANLSAEDRQAINKSQEDFARVAIAKQDLINQQKQGEAKATAQSELNPVNQEQIQALEVLGTGSTETQAQTEEFLAQGEGAFSQAKALGAAAAGLTGGAALGAGVGALGGPFAPITIPAGAAIGGVTGALGGYFGSISFEKKQDVKNSMSVYTGSKSNMMWIINQVNSGRMSGAQASEMFNEEKTNFYVARDNLKKLTDGNLDRFLSGGVDDLAKVYAFEDRLPFMQEQLAQAILMPDPNKILSEVEIIQE